MSFTLNYVVILPCIDYVPLAYNIMDGYKKRGL